MPSVTYKKKPTADQQLAKVPLTDETIETVLLFMSVHEISLRSACAQCSVSYVATIQRVAQSPKLRILDSSIRTNYMREKVREMNMIATLEEDPIRARLKCDNIKWEASRIMRSEFGDHVTVAGDKDNPLTIQHVVSGNDLANKIRGRIIEHDADPKD